jgi:hypothetical protein
MIEIQPVRAFVCSHAVAVTVMSRQPGMMIGIGSAYDAAKFILEEWPDDDDGEKLETARVILLKCLAGDCSSRIARVAFIEAAREADIFVETPKRPPPTGKLQRWYKSKPRRS